MPHAAGTRLGGMATLDDLKGRCYVDRTTWCWHLRTGHGRAIPHDGKRQMVWVHARGGMTSLRAAWLLAHGLLALQELDELGHVVYRSCTSHDCVNPRHLLAGTKGESIRRQMALGVMATAHHRAQAAATGRARAVLTPELRTWLMESSQSAVVVAHALGVGHGRVSTIRADARRRVQGAVVSVFDLGAAVQRTRMAA